MLLFSCSTIIERVICPHRVQLAHPFYIYIPAHGREKTKKTEQKSVS